MNYSVCNKTVPRRVNLSSTKGKQALAANIWQLEENIWQLEENTGMAQDLLLMAGKLVLACAATDHIKAEPKCWI